MSRADQLRDEFDRSFAAARIPSASNLVDLLAIDIARDPHAVRVADISATFVDRPITRIPSTAPAVLGIAGIRGAVVPVFDLAALLGYPSQVAASPRWLLVTEGQIAFAVTGLSGHVRIGTDQITSTTDARSHVRELARIGDVVRPVVHLMSVLEAIRRN